MKQKILIYLCMNAIFSKTMQENENLTVYFEGKTMQDTETKI